MLTNLAPTGGIERDAVKCMKELATNDFHIHLIVAFVHEDMFNALSNLPISWYRVRTFKRPPSIGQVLFCIRTNSILKKIRRQYGDMECISFETLPPATILVGSTSQRLWKKARIQGGMGRSLRPFWNAWKTYCEISCLKNTKKIAVYSEQVKQAFIEDGTPSEKIDRIIIPSDTTVFTPYKPSPLYKRKELLIIGANPKLKGIDIMMMAWQGLSDEFPNLSLRIVTKGWKVKTLVKKINAPRVIISPFIPDPREYYNNARLVISPSVYESWGNVVIEALASGIPVVASSQTPSSEIIQDREHGTCFTRNGDNDYKKLAQSIRGALKNSSDQNSGMDIRHRQVLSFQANNPETTSWIVSRAIKNN